MDALQLLEELGEVAPVDTAVLDRSVEPVMATAGTDATAVPAGVVPVGAGPVVGHPAGRRHRPGTTRRRHPRRRARSAVAAVVVLGAAVAGVLLAPGTPVGPTPAAAAVLHHLADVAAAQPAPTVPGPGQYLYVHSQDAYTSTAALGGGASYTVLLPKDRQIWIGADGSGRLLETAGHPTFLSAADRAAWVAAGSPSIPGAGTSDTAFGPAGLSAGPDLSRLPTDPAALSADISSRRVEGGPPGTAEDFTQIGDLLRETDASPALRAALYQVASGLPGVTLLGPVTDHAGRAGTAVAYTDHGTQDELIFDPRTSALLGEQTTVIGAGSGLAVAHGTVVGWAVYLESSVMNSTGTPTPGQTGTPTPGQTGAPAPPQGTAT